MKTSIFSIVIAHIKVRLISKEFFLLLILILSPWMVRDSFSQDQKEINEYQEVPIKYLDEVRTGFVPDTLPKYPSGNYGIRIYIARNIRFPEKAARRSEKGRVIVSYAINVDGSVDEIQVIQSVSESLDKEFMRVLKEMEDWMPAIKEGKPVKVYYKQFVDFVLN